MTPSDLIPVIGGIVGLAPVAITILFVSISISSPFFKFALTRFLSIIVPLPCSTSTP